MITDFKTIKTICFISCLADVDVDDKIYKKILDVEFLEKKKAKRLYI